MPLIFSLFNRWLADQCRALFYRFIFIVIDDIMNYRGVFYGFLMMRLIIMIIRACCSLLIR